MAKTAIAQKRKKNNTVSTAIFVAIILSIAIIFGIQYFDTKQKYTSYKEQETYLEEMISKENDRTEELEQYAKYVQTKAFAGEEAQKKLNFAKEGEIIFRRDHSE